MTLVSCLDLHIDDSIATLTIRRQHKLNALTGQLVDELFDACRKIEKSNAWVVIISGEGSKAFSAGGDIEDWSSLCAEDLALRWVRDGHDAFDALARLRQPVIAVLNGHTLGGGLELAACADYRIAESHVKLGQPEAGLGIIAGWSGSQRASRRLGAQIVRRMTLFGEIFEANTALHLGIVDQVVESGAGMASAKVLADKVLKRSPKATMISKMLINAAEGEERERVIESLGGWAASMESDLVEGLSAFREKRTPSF